MYEPRCTLPSTAKAAPISCARVEKETLRTSPVMPTPSSDESNR